MVLAYEFTWPEELNVIGYDCAKFNFHFVNFIRKVVHIQKMLCTDEMLILRWTLRKYVVGVASISSARDRDEWAVNVKMAFTLQVL